MSSKRSTSHWLYVWFWSSDMRALVHSVSSTEFSSSGTSSGMRRTFLLMARIWVCWSPPLPPPPLLLPPPPPSPDPEPAPTQRVRLFCELIMVPGEGCVDCPPGGGFCKTRMGAGEESGDEVEDERKGDWISSLMWRPAEVYPILVYDTPEVTAGKPVKHYVMKGLNIK